ncbi:MAG: DUF2934 domain-containing protein [Methylophilus sp.]
MASLAQPHNSTNSTKHLVGEKTEEAWDEEVRSRIAERAYYKAEARGYEPGHEIQDWIEAEAEIQAEVSR